MDPSSGVQGCASSRSRIIASTALPPGFDRHEMCVAGDPEVVGAVASHQRRLDPRAARSGRLASRRSARDSAPRLRPPFTAPVAIWRAARPESAMKPGYRRSRSSGGRSFISMVSASSREGSIGRPRAIAGRYAPGGLQHRARERHDAARRHGAEQHGGRERGRVSRDRPSPSASAARPSSGRRPPKGPTDSSRSPQIRRRDRRARSARGRPPAGCRRGRAGSAPMRPSRGRPRARASPRRASAAAHRPWRNTIGPRARTGRLGARAEP